MVGWPLDMREQRPYNDFLVSCSCIIGHPNIWSFLLSLGTIIYDDLLDTTYLSSSAGDSVDGTSQSVTTATPKATPPTDTPHITGAGFRGRDTGGVAGAIVAMVVIVIVVVAIVITVTFCSLRRKANNRQM